MLLSDRDIRTELESGRVKIDPFDPSMITPYALRHSYAQRHADAGVPVDVLKDLLDHAAISTTMGGAVSGVAGPNWMLIGDAAACVNPLNGEGIDYELETGRLAAEMLGTDDLSSAWPAVLSAHYARAFSAARRLGSLLTIPRFLPMTGPLAMHSSVLLKIAVRVMGNLVTDEDADWLARVWRGAGVASRRIDERPPFS